MTAIPVDQYVKRGLAPKRVRLMPLVALIFFSVSGGAYGIESLFSTSGPGMAIVLIIVTPLIYSVPNSLICAELGTAIPVEGGYYHWVKKGLGKFWGFQQGILQWVCSFVDMALYPVLFTSYLQSLASAVAPGKHVLFTVGHLQFDLNWFICLAVIAVFTLVNLLGAGWVGESSVVFALICLTPMVILTVVGVAHLVGHGINPVSSLTSSSDQSTWNAFGSGLFIVMWNYSGWDSVSNVAGEMENPRKHLPKALAMAMVLIMVGYLLPTLASLATGPDGDAGWKKWQAGSFSDVAKQLAGPWLQVTVTVGGMFAAVAMFSALLASNSRLPMVLAQDGYFPKWVAKESRRYRMPIVSIIGSSTIYALFCLSSFTNLVIFDVFLTNIGILLEVAALIALRIKEPELERPYRIPGGWYSIAGIVLCLVSVCGWAGWEQYSQNGTQAVTYCLVIVAGSCLLYLPLEWWRARKARIDPTLDLSPGSPAYTAWLAEATSHAVVART
ncbi:amino acid transporter [Kitasatospora sp. MAP12-15]|uniref:APC family permease n=1 Tax=unclassified Kitasatospora TaxID=2633591 RepID=UPI002474BA06|nr:APC family permease [Kitasatospora sp. MAP12-44]MDH6109931.1 amino acid transporter [Kitasatospora sp. MAP12-44]